MKLLKKEYKRRSHLRPLLWDSTIQLPIEQVYTRLKIVSRGKWAIQIKDDDVNVFDIFKVPDIGEDVMTIVEGSPGIGKTTFCLKLAYDWAHGNIPSECSFPKFEFVFLLKCRDIDGDIMKAISEQLLPRDMDMKKSVEKLLHLMKDIHNQERLMLIILDGLDELPEKSRHHVDELLNRRILAFCYVLATTRQERGIEVRKMAVFDSHLEIKGYTESDSIAYIRRHFETIDQSPKGEKLVEEMQQNTFLHALRNNPLNLLLLCVVYEDFEGELPTSRTELYQVIVQCLLRRYCAKRNKPAPRNDIALERKFEKEILALGELAWLCLLSDRYGFRESELDEFESRYPGLVARELGLLYKEESLKRLKPEHEYCFLHKTFQEYMAAAYIAEKLVKQQFNVFDDILFVDLVTKYLQVFIFVSAMLSEKATVLFTQIGEELKKNNWDWKKHCTEVEATFFIESFNESGHPELMAATLCQIVPFPKVITVKSHDDYNASFVKVLMACKRFSNLQTPAELCADICLGSEVEGSDVVSYIESWPQLTIVSFALGSLSFTFSFADRLCKWFSVSKSLSEFTLKFRNATPDECDLLFQICHELASCPTPTVKFSLPGYAYSEGFFNALETGLAPPTSVGLELLGSMKYTATRALQNFLSNKSLKSFSLSIVEVDVQDLLVAAVSEALARHKVLKSLDLHFGGPLSSSSANFLEKGLMENSSLNYLRLCFHGELPDNWHSVMESGHPEQMAATLCQIVPFPKVITVKSHDDYNASFVKVLMACKRFSNLQTLAELCAGICLGSEVEGSEAVSYIESWPQLTIVGFALGSLSFTSSFVDRLCKWLSASKSLSEFTLKFRNATPDECDLLFQICHELASCPTPTVKFSLPGYAYSEGFFNALETGLAPPTSVGLELLGSMKYTATRALQNFLSNKSLKSFSLSIVEVDVQDLLVAAVSEALARHKVLKSLDLHFGGPLSSSSANFLEKGLMENSSLNYLRLCVHGELPGNWHSVMENLRLAKKPSVVCSIYPNTWNNVADNLCRPVMVRKGLNLKQHFTVNIWGEMSCEAAKALCEALALSSITSLTLNVRGNLTSEVANSVARCLEGNQTLSFLSINMWGELTTEGGILFSRLSKDNLSVQLNVHDVRTGPDESNDVFDITKDNPEALRAFFTKIKERRKEKVSLTINDNGYVIKEWTRCIGDALAENTLLTSLDLTVNCCPVDADLGENLGKSLLQSTSLTSLSLTFNCINMKEGWLSKLGDSLDKMASLTSLSLDVNFYGEGNKWAHSTNVLVPIKSLSTLSVVVHSKCLESFWNDGVGDCLRDCSSLKKLSLTFNVEGYSKLGFFGLLDGLARTTTLNTFSLAIFANQYFADTCSKFFASLNHGFSLNASVRILAVTVTVNEFLIVEFPVIFKEGLSMNESVTALSLTINDYGEGESHIPLVLDHSGVFQFLAQNTSVTTFNLTLNSSKEVSDDWLPGLSYALKKNTSLTTLRLKVNSHCATGNSRLYDYSKLMIESQTLSLLELEVSVYGKDTGYQKLSIQ